MYRNKIKIYGNFPIHLRHHKIRVSGSLASLSQNIIAIIYYSWPNISDILYIAFTYSLFANCVTLAVR